MSKGPQVKLFAPIKGSSLPSQSADDPNTYWQCGLGYEEIERVIGVTVVSQLTEDAVIAELAKSPSLHDYRRALQTIEAASAKAEFSIRVMIDSKGMLRVEPGNVTYSEGFNNVPEIEAEVNRAVASLQQDPDVNASEGKSEHIDEHHILTSKGPGSYELLGFHNSERAEVGSAKLIGNRWIVNVGGLTVYSGTDEERAVDTLWARRPAYG
jgi:hypothetical protein